jgi:hypothetical protein
MFLRNVDLHLSNYTGPLPWSQWLMLAPTGPIARKFSRECSVAKTTWEESTWETLTQFVMCICSLFNDALISPRLDWLVYSCCSHLEHRTSLKRFASLQFLNLRHSAGLLGRVISPSQSRYLTQTDIHASSGIRTHDPSVRASEDRSCLRPRGHCDRPSTGLANSKLERMSKQLQPNSWYYPSIFLVGTITMTVGLRVDLNPGAPEHKGVPHVT